MYNFFIAVCFAIGPIVSIIVASIIRRTRSQSRNLWDLALRWFTFWIVGIRLLTAGAAQALRPEFTAEQIFGTTDPTVLPFIQELGFANLAFGTIGILCLFVRPWTVPAALAGVVFLGLDGIRHLFGGGGFTTDRIVAMVTDLIALVVLGGCLIALAVRTRGTNEATSDSAAQTV